MSYVAVSKDGTELIGEPIVGVPNKVWFVAENEYITKIPKGSIEKLIGRTLTWEDELVELKDDNLSVCCGADIVQCRNDDFVCQNCGMIEKKS